MPSSCPYNISRISDVVYRLKPGSILDIGPGFGKYGVIFREYIDAWFGRQHKEQWKGQIDCVEIFEKYITPLHKYIYDNVYIGDIRTMPIKGTYAMIFMGDVIEHFTKAEGYDLLKRLQPHAQHILISTPYWQCQNKHPENPNEEHISFWQAEDFKDAEGWDVIESYSDRRLGTVLLKRRVK